MSCLESNARRIRWLLAAVGVAAFVANEAPAQVPPPRADPSPEIGFREFRVEDATGIRTSTGGRMTDLSRQTQSGRRSLDASASATDRIRVAQVPQARPAEIPPIRAGVTAESIGPGNAPREPSRLRNLAGVPGLSDPEPNPEVDRQYGEFIERTIDPQKTLDLIVDRPRILVFKEMPSRLYIAQETIASYEIISDTEIAIVGVGEGRTVLTIWVPDPVDPSKNKVLSYLVRVAEDPEYKERLEGIYAALEKEINRNFPDSFVKLALIGDQLVVRGQAKDVVEAAQIIRICEEHAPPSRKDQDDTKVSSITQTVFSPFANSTQTGDFGEDGLSIERLAEAGLEGESNVINMLKIPGEQQVMLRIIVAEVNRSAVRQLGANLAVQGNSTQFLSAFPAFNLISNVVTGQMTEEGGSFAISRGDFGVTLSALRRLNLARTLAEPTLVALNGRPARFFAGGQFPIPAAVSTFGSTGQSVQFQPFGVQLQFVPYIVDRDKVRLTVSSSVSTRDETLTTGVGGSAGAGGTQVSGLQSRTFSTTVELREGETMGVAGLIQSNFGSNGARVPLFGDLPFIGRAFGSDGTSADEQELLILISPEFQHPVSDTRGLTLPGADVTEPGDAEFYLKGQLESRRSEDFRSPVRTDFDKQMRYHYGEDLYLVGPFGYSFGNRKQGAPSSPSAQSGIETLSYEEPAEVSKPRQLPASLPAPAPLSPPAPRRVPLSEE
jgi:pilus assembly protein CpaC